MNTTDSMIPRDEEFLKRLLATFRVEAAEHLEQLSNGLVSLEKAPAPEAAEIVEEVFREAHSLKGAARAVRMTDIEILCQNMESVLAALKHEEILPYATMYDTLHEAVGIIQTYLSTTEDDVLVDIRRSINELAVRIDDGLYQARHAGNGMANPHLPAVDDTVVTSPVREAPSIPSPPPDTNRPVTPPAAPEPMKRAPRPPAESAAVQAIISQSRGRVAANDTIRISTSKLDSLLLQTEELLIVKLITAQHTQEAATITARFEAIQKEWKAVLSDIRSLRQWVAREVEAGNATDMQPMQKVLSFLDWVQSQISMLESRAFTVRKNFRQDNHLLSGMVDTLMEDMKEVLMLPFASLLTMMPKVVRDLAGDLGRRVDFEMKGADIEIDRRILEEMKDPLIHMIRNCIDHGIERPEVRTAAGKDQRGNVHLVISRIDSGTVEIMLEDDGSGIDPNRVRAAAVRHGILSHDAAANMSDHEAMMLIFKSDVTTSETITDISGRGLGLAIVREKVERMGGTIHLDSVPGKGTTMRIHLPLTLATFRGILVTAAGQSFIIPTINVERVIRIAAGDVQTVENRETVMHHGRPVSFVRLEEVLELSSGRGWPKSVPYMPALVLGSGDERVVFAVEEVQNEQEVLVKPFNRQLVRVRNIAGATILGSGNVVPILNVQDLLATVERGSTGAVRMPAPAEEETPVPGSILVVDDSITSRMLLKDILESAGYQVHTAIDGVDALSLLKTDHFDLVVSDVEMPRMSGFDLTSRIRADGLLSTLPVILVTALASAQDRERGIDAGANAYIVKSSFEQGNLLDIVQRLI